jgi:PKD repeat protein
MRLKNWGHALLACALLPFFAACQPIFGPTAAFDFEPDSGFPPLKVQFLDQSLPGLLPVTSWQWDFGDGNSSRARNPVHTYEQAGTFTVALTAGTGLSVHRRTATVVVDPLREAIGLSNTQLNFELNPLPRDMTVWNSNPDIEEELRISVTPSHPWIQVSASTITPPAPGRQHEQRLTVTVNRANLPPGEHEGTITFTSLGIVTRVVTVRATQAL